VENYLFVDPLLEIISGQTNEIGQGLSVYVCVRCMWQVKVIWVRKENVKRLTSKQVRTVTID